MASQIPCSGDWFVVLRSDDDPCDVVFFRVAMWEHTDDGETHAIFVGTEGSLESTEENEFMLGIAEGWMDVTSSHWRDVAKSLEQERLRKEHQAVDDAEIARLAGLIASDELKQLRDCERVGGSLEVTMHMGKCHWLSEKDLVYTAPGCYRLTLLGERVLRHLEKAR